MPSAIAARVACSESSTRWRTSLASAFVGAPTRMIAALPESRAMRSEKKSSSVPIVARASSARSCESRVSKAARSPRPPMIVVLSLVTRTCVARPRCSVVICSSANDELLLCTLPPAQRGHVLEQVDPLLAEARGLDRHGLEDAG